MATPVSFEDFRRGAAAPPPPGPAPPPLPGPGLLPLPVGTARRLTPAEAAALPRLGWQQGDPIPGELADVIAAHAADARATQGLLPVPADTPPVALDPIDIERLPPEARRDVVASVQALLARHRAADASRAAAGDPALPPGVAAAIDLGARMEADRGGAVTGNRAAAPPGDNPFDNLRTLAAQVAAERAGGAATPPPPPTATAAAAPPPPEDDGAADTGTGRADCPHCGWALDRPDEIDPGPADKHAFLAMILGGPQARFRKEVALFGGALVATFRTLTALESDLPWQQLAADVVAGKHTGGMDRLAAIQTYRLALTLDTVEVRGMGLVRVPEAAAARPDDGDATPLPALSAWINASVLPQENLRRAVEQAFFRFQRLAEKLEANATNESFYEGIGSPP